MLIIENETTPTKVGCFFPVSHTFFNNPKIRVRGDGVRGDEVMGDEVRGDEVMSDE